MSITEKRRLGNIGENVAVEFLVRRGHKILDRNYLKKWGEIDIVSLKSGVIHFVEVKSTGRAYVDVSHVTVGKGTHETYRPEENVHPQKLKRLARTIQSYLLEKGSDDAEWQIDIIVAYVDEQSRQARVEIIENIVI